jgi:hypothetical protein
MPQVVSEFRSYEIRQKFLLGRPKQNRTENMEAVIFTLIGKRNGHTQHERFVPESAEFQPFDLRALRHSYNAEELS